MDEERELRENAEEKNKEEEQVLAHANRAAARRKDAKKADISA